MKPLFENWRQYLNEELLTEFDKGDEETLMAEQDRFTISYEIELESKEPLAHEDIRELTLQLENVPAYYHGARTAENFFQHYFKEPYVDEDDIIDFYKRENLIPLPQQSKLETKEFKDFAGELATLTPSQMQNIPRYLKVEDITDKEFLKKFIMFYKKLAYEFEEQLMYELHEDPIAFARKYLSEVIPESELGKYTGQEAIPVLREFFPRFMKKWEGQLKFDR